MSKAIAMQTFHHSGGTVWGGQEFDSGDAIVQAFLPLFSVIDPAPSKPAANMYKDGYEEQSLGVLRNLAKQRKLDSSGSKEEIVARLREDDGN